MAQIRKSCALDKMRECNVECEWYCHTPTGHCVIWNIALDLERIRHRIEVKERPDER